ncbi:MAG: hypothetical protein GWO04_14415, partial [Actinobacteria bacterium]|nr:hypothetical protein [Actinomycetota bacterium]
LDPEYAAGTWFGKLQPRTPFRLRTDEIPSRDLYYGFVDGGFEQRYAPPSDATCVVRLVDLLGVLQGLPLPGGAYDAEVMASEPVAWWRLDETSGTAMVDSSGNGHDGLIVNGELGRDPLVVGSEHSYFVPAEPGNYGIFEGESLPSGPPVSIEAW